MTHDELRDLVAVYALDALAPEEAEQVEAHLPSCRECRQQLALLREAAASLAAGVAQSAPPPGLRDRILEAARLGPRRAPSPPRAWMLGLAAAAALIVLLGGIDVSLKQRLAELTRTQAQLVTLLASPSARTAILAGTSPATVRLVFDPTSRRGALVATGLGDPGRGLVYQLWLVVRQKPESAGVFRPAPGRLTIVPVAADFDRYDAVAITVERAPRGAPRPTTTPILAGALPGPG